MKLADSVAFVTGANRGLDRELVARFLHAGVAKLYAGIRDVGLYDPPDCHRGRGNQDIYPDPESRRFAGLAVTAQSVLMWVP